MLSLQLNKSAIKLFDLVVREIIYSGVEILEVQWNTVCDPVQISLYFCPSFCFSSPVQIKS